MSDPTFFSPYRVAARDAEQKFRVVDSGVSEAAVYLTAEAGTGSRYAVVVNRLPDAALPREGGLYLISVLQPWQANMVWTVDGSQIHSDYLLEKLTPRDRVATGLHGGDAMALCMAVNRAAKMMHAVDSGLPV